MLAFTTNLEPRNLLIDLAFFGLSTMTRLRPRLPTGGVELSSEARAAFALAGLAAVEALLDAARFLGEAVWAVSGDVDFEDFRATVSSYPAPFTPLPSRSIAIVSMYSATSGDPVCDCSRYVS